MDWLIKYGLGNSTMTVYMLQRKRARKRMENPVMEKKGCPSSLDPALKT